ncbi:MAG: biotin--[acetyl-CoA-carboxylase] ligase [Planctomycetota bacterium]
MPRSNMDSDENLEAVLKRRTRFQSLRHVAACESTQDIANEGSGSTAPLPDAVFWADHQTSGRGRQQRVWHDETGLDVAVTFRITEEFPRPMALPAALPVAVLEACEPLAETRLRIKWPNDIYVGSDKLSGVLIDRDSRRPHTYRIGVGINVNGTHFPAGLRNPATSLRALTGKLHDRHQLLADLAESVDSMLHAAAAEELTGHETIFRERLGLLGHPVEVTAGSTTTGTLTDINFERLVLDGRAELPLAIVTSLRRASL